MSDTETRPSNIEGTIYEEVDELRAEVGRQEEYINAVHDLFNEYQEDFGLDDADFPDDKPQDRAIEYEGKFRVLQCTYLGHEVYPDHCGKPEHDFCYRCRKTRVELGIPDPRTPTPEADDTKP